MATSKGRRHGVAIEVYDDHGVRFEYPSDWVVEVTDEDEVTTVDLQHPEGVAFVLVRIDETCADPEETCDMVLEAMRLKSIPSWMTPRWSRHLASTSSPGTMSSFSRSMCPTRPVSAVSAPRGGRCSFLASGRISAAKACRMLSVVFSGRWKSWRIDRGQLAPGTCVPAATALFACSTEKRRAIHRGGRRPLCRQRRCGERRRLRSSGVCGEGAGETGGASSIETTVSLVPWRIKVGHVTCRAES